jgi:hypothetical protein
MTSLEKPDQGPKIRPPTEPKDKSTDENEGRRQLGSRLGAALTGQLIVGSPLASKLDANALAP